MTVELCFIFGAIGIFLLGVVTGALLTDSLAETETPLYIEEGLCSTGKPEDIPDDIKEMLGL